MTAGPWAADPRHWRGPALRQPLGADVRERRRSTQARDPLRTLAWPPLNRIGTIDGLDYDHDNSCLLPC